MKFKRFFYRLSHFPPRAAYALGLGPLLGKFVLLLTTRGRKTGKARVTPLQFEEINGVIHIGSAMGLKADWVRNVLANPDVNVQIGKRYFSARMQIITDPEKVVDFIEFRITRHPKMIRMIMRMDGMKGEINRDALVHYARNIVVGRIEENMSETSNQ